MNDGLDRAHSILKPFRFGFPPVVLGMGIFGVRPTQQLEDRLRSVFEGVISDISPRDAKTISGGPMWHHSFRQRASSDATPTFGIFLYDSSRRPLGEFDSHPDLDLLETVASYAGAELSAAEVPQSLWNDPSNVDYSLESQVRPRTRWYYQILSDERLSKDLAPDYPEAAFLRICDDALGASWSKLNDMLRPSLATKSPEPHDHDEREIIALLSQVGHRMTTGQLLAEFERSGQIKAESTVKLKLSRMVAAGLLTNRQDIKPHKGYGLPAWE